MSEPVKKADLGVLFVHGIGEQLQGETLVQFADPLSTWVVRWLSRGALAEPGIGQTDDDGHVVVSGTRIAPDDGAPARTAMVVNAPPGEQLGGRTDWLLAESWWAETFHPPKTTTVILWLFVVLPYLLLEHTYVPLSRSIRVWRQTRGWGHVPAALRTVGFALFFVASLPIAAIAEIIVSLLLVPLLIPIPSVRDFAKNAVVKLANTLGDCFVLTSSTVQFDAMVRQVAHDLAWLSSQAETVAVVAHSQGAAVAHEAIREYGPTPNLSLFATVGQGLAKLHRVRMLRRTHKTAGFGFAWLGLVGVYLVMALTTRVVVSFVRGDVSWPLTALWVAGIVAIAVPYALFQRFMRDTVREEQALLFPPDHRPAEWVNYYASLDPVSNGPLFSEPRPEVDEREVWNQASLLTDHTSYTKDPDDFFAHLTMKLFSKIGGSPPAETIAALDRARWRRAWRVWWLSTSRLVAVASGIIIVYGVWDQLDAIGGRVIDHTPAWLATIVHTFTRPLRTMYLVGDLSSATLVGIATVAVLLAAAFVLVALIWQSWDGRDVGRFFARRDDYATTSALGGRLFVLFVGSLIILLAIAIYIGVTGDYAAVWNFVGDHVVRRLQSWSQSLSFWVLRASCRDPWHDASRTHSFYAQVVDFMKRPCNHRCAGGSMRGGPGGTCKIGSAAIERRQVDVA